MMIMMMMTVAHTNIKFLYKALEIELRILPEVHYMSGLDERITEIRMCAPMLLSKANDLISLLLSIISLKFKLRHESMLYIAVSM